MTGLSSWRVEWWRLTRTRRLVALLGTFVFFGLAGPLFARYAADLLGSADSSGITITVPPPVPADGIGGYTQGAMQLGLLVSVVVAAFALALDANPALAVYYRTRVRRLSALLVPRLVVAVAGAVGAYLAGLLICWYETAVLIGQPGTVAVVVSAATGSLYLTFAVAVTAFAGTVARSTLGTVGYALAVLIGSPVVGAAVPGAARWVPSALAGAPEAVMRQNTPGEYILAAVVTAILSAGCLAGALLWGQRTEL
jgi:ABC-2 type transport system permease protein